MTEGTNKSTRGLHETLEIRGAPRIFPPPSSARFVGAREGLRLYIDKTGSDWTYFVIGPGDVLFAFNGFRSPFTAEQVGVSTLSKLANRVVV